MSVSKPYKHRWKTPCRTRRDKENSKTASTSLDIIRLMMDRYESKNHVQD